MIQVIAHDADLIDALAAGLIDTHAARLPDLTAVTVLLPNLQAMARLRRRLLVHARAHGCQALLGPAIDTLDGWTRRQPNQNLPVLTEHQRTLMLVEALIKHPYLYGAGNPWMLADCLLELFDELNEVRYQPPEQLADFLAQLHRAYGVADTGHASLAGEARLVHTLWQAWHRQMREDGVCDRHTDALLRLSASLDAIAPGQSFHLTGFTRLTPPQAHWLRTLLERQQARVYLHGAAPPAAICGYHWEDVSGRLLDALDADVARPAATEDFARILGLAYDSGAAPLRERAAQASLTLPQSPLSGRLRVLPAANAEQEAQAIDLQVRRWWLEGRCSIGIVTENRRLARRVRALLERAGITLQDAAGWALSTTSAAATLERWLEAVEEDFPYQPLLDLLKSPFLVTQEKRETHLATVYRFEQGIVLKENIPRGLARYRQHTHYRQNRLPPEMAAEYDGIHSLLDMLAQASAPLAPFLNQRRHAPSKIVQALLDSLAALGLHASLKQDAAGARILEELRQMQAASGGSTLRMDWREFRTWLGRTLERFNFQPPAQTGAVQLMSLAQSGVCRFDAVILAGVEREYLPGGGGNSPFFNDGVRQALGLRSRAQLLEEKFYLFRRLLGAAPQVLLTHCREQDGEPIPPSPWLARLQAFHRLAYGDDLADTELLLLAGDARTQVTDHSGVQPQPVAARPRVSIDATLLPTQLSASGYQQLIDCPYQFYAARCLQLSPPEAIREMLEKADYGERVHLCLQAFHSDVERLPGPFAQPLTERNRAQAEQLLAEIGRAVFARDLEDNFLHRGWLHRWLDTIPGYVDWQLQRQEQWHVRATEARLNAPLPDSTLTLQGRLDRIDTGAHGVGILDYKTGKVATRADAEILSGEDVQLPFYVLLAQQILSQPVALAEYLPLEQTPIRARGTLEPDALHDISARNGDRLRELMRAMQDGAPLPAWGDDKTCGYCQFAGVCRRQTWREDTA